MSVSVLPASSALGGGFGAHSAMQNGVSRSHDELSVAELKERAKGNAQKATRGASALSLIKSARSQIILAQNYESSGDLKGAYSAYIKAVSLTQSFMDNAEFKVESQPGKRGILTREFQDYMQHEGGSMGQRVESLESRLKEIEKSSPAPANDASSPDDGPIVASGGSIADRMRALQNAGMSVSTGKRLAKDAPPAPSTPPMSPVTTRSNRDSVQSHVSLGSLVSPTQRSFASVPPPVSIQTQLASPPLISTASTSSEHAFVSPSTLGPPSPTSSSSSSPRATSFNLTGFAQTFPSIDEFEEMTSARSPPLPSVVTAGSSTFAAMQAASSSALPSPTMAARAYPVLPTDTGSSSGRHQPVGQSHTGGSHRADSPARTHGPSPVSPSVPRKPSNLSLHSPSPLPGKPALPPSVSPSQGSPSTLPPASSPQGSASQTKPDLPVSNSVTPQKLRQYLDDSSLKVLLVDVRTRTEFENEYIKHPGDALVCLEPSVLGRENVTGESIENSLSIAPSIEWTLFSNRDKFDLIVMYDANSTSFTPFFATLVRAIYERAFRKILKHMPVLLVGGITAWKEEVGEDGVVHGKYEEEDVRGRHHHQQSRDHRHHRPGDTNHVNGRSEGSRPGSGLEDLRSPVPDVTSSAVGRIRAQAEPTYDSRTLDNGTHSPHFSSSQFGADQVAGPSRPHGSSTPTMVPDIPPLRRKAAMSRPPSTKPQIDGVMSSTLTSPAPQSWSSASSSIQYPTFNHSMQSGSVSRTMTPTMPPSSFASPVPHAGIVSPPPQASINPSPLSRRRSDYIDQSQEALAGSGLGTRPSIDYPDLSAHNVLRPPPAVAPPQLERQDNRPRIVQHQPPPPPSTLPPFAGPKAPTIQSEYPVQYWPDVSIATSGLKNMGNTCYMNATIQCLNATVPFARFFVDGKWRGAVNMVNPLGTKGNVAKAFAGILVDMWKQETAYLTPIHFRRSITSHASQFEGNEQHDCQEFLNFLLDGLHEDLNRILSKPTYQATPEREAELERLPQQIASEQEWAIYRMRNDSLVVDYFQGQFRNRLECLTCHRTSTTYNTFMYLTLPIPTKNTKTSLYQCLEAFVKEEVMEKSDAWMCPHCKALRKATKLLSLSRLPPVLLIHLKRFSSKGQVTDKLETFVDFPIKGLDLTGFMPNSLSPAVEHRAQQLPMDDPRVQSPPYRYDLYGVTNHFGSLSSGHYTAFIANRGGWMYCDDSRLTSADPKDVVGKPAYVLFYKRVKA